MTIRHRCGVMISMICFFWCSNALCEEPQDTAKQQVNVLEEMILKYVGALGTENEETLSDQMWQQRSSVVKLGEPAIPHLRDLLKHKQVNVRRGAAIAMSMIVEKQKIRDRKLLDQVLLRMIEEDDIKARSNLYHVANGIIDNLQPKLKTEH